MAFHSATIQALNDYWDEMSHSRVLRLRLRDWQQEFPAIVGDTPDEVVAAARDRPAGARECPTLDALVKLSPSDEWALQMVVQAMLPRWCAIIARTSRPGLSGDDLASVVVSIGIETILTCRNGVATTPMDYRLWSDTRHRVHRHLARYYPAVESPTDPASFADLPAVKRPRAGDTEAAELEEWIRARSDLSAERARLVAMTRTTTSSLHDIAAATGVAYNTLAKRRARAERRIAAALA